jgi:hypothetical protein
LRDYFDATKVETFENLHGGLMLFIDRVRGAASLVPLKVIGAGGETAALRSSNRQLNDNRQLAELLSSLRFGG